MLDIFSFETWQEGIIQYFQQTKVFVSVETLTIELGVLFLSVLLGMVFAHWTRQALSVCPRLEESTREITAFIKRLLVSFVRHSSSAFYSALLIVLAFWIMKSGFGWTQTSLVFLKLGYSVFFAYVALQLILSVVQFFTGKAFLTPKENSRISTAFWTLVILDLLGVLDEAKKILMSTHVPIGSGDITLWHLFEMTITVMLFLVVAQWISKRIEGKIQASENLSGNLKVALSRLIHVSLIVLAFIIAFSSGGVDLTVLSVIGGGLSVGLGFGLQKIAANYISGFIVLLDRSINIGDMVEVGGFKGIVTQINTRYSVVRNADGVENIVPNENFITQCVKNFGLTDSSAVSYVTISVGYNSNVERALEIMLEEGMRERARIDTSRKGWAYLDKFGDSGIDLKMGFWVVDPQRGVASLSTKIALAIYRRFQEEGIEVPFPQQEVTLRAVTPEVAQLIKKAP